MWDVGTAEKELKLLSKWEKIKIYLNGLDRVFEVNSIVIEGFNHAVNFDITSESVHFLFRPGKIDPVMWCDKLSIYINEKGTEDG